MDLEIHITNLLQVYRVFLFFIDAIKTTNKPFTIGVLSLWAFYRKQNRSFHPLAGIQITNYA